MTKRQRVLDIFMTLILLFQLFLTFYRYVKFQQDIERTVICVMLYWALLRVTRKQS